MASYIQLQITNPCDQNLEQMQQTSEGHYCSSCCKTVIDFTGMTDNQLVEYFKDLPTSICGKLHPGQLNNTLEVPTKKIPWMKYFFQVSIPAMLLGFKADAQKLLKRNSIPTEQTESKPVVHETKAESIVSGRVLDESGMGIPYVSVTVPGSTIGNTSDSNGMYSLKVPASIRFLKLSSIGYFDQLTAVFDGMDIKPVVLKRIMSTTVVVTAGGLSVVRVVGRRTKKKNATITPKLSPVEKNAIELFPNPVKLNGVLTVRLQNAVSNDQLITLYDIGGTIILQKSADKKQLQAGVQVSLNLKSAGYYVLQVADIKTNEKHVVPVIVE